MLCSRDDGTYLETPTDILLGVYSYLTGNRRPRLTLEVVASHWTVGSYFSYTCMTCHCLSVPVSFPLLLMPIR